MSSGIFRFGLGLLLIVHSGALLAASVEKRLASNNALLKSLEVSRGKLAPAFKSRRLRYGDKVAASVNHVLFTALSADKHAQLSIAGLGFGKGKLTTMVPLFGHSTLVLLVVTAEDGKTFKTYQVKIRR
jgi:hypothetical protein